MGANEQFRITHDRDGFVAAIPRPLRCLFAATDRPNDTGIPSLLMEKLGDCNITVLPFRSDEICTSRDQEIDVVLLNSGVTDGVDLLKTLRARYALVPVVYAASDRFNRHLALELGADYVLDDCHDVRYVASMIRAAVRSVARARQLTSSPAEVSHGPLRLQRTQRLVHVLGNSRRLAGADFEILWKLASRMGQPVSRSELSDCIGPIKSRSVDARISRLKRRIDSPSVVISNVWGIGYRLDVAPGE